MKPQNEPRWFAALLPRDSREHVLGDLAQRGNRLGDILSVLPRVWWSRGRRAWFGPVPSLAAASECDLRRRCRQMELGTLISFAAVFVKKCVEIWFGHISIWWMLFFGSCLLLVLIGAGDVLQSSKSFPLGYWLQRYRAMLTARKGWRGYFQPAMLASSSVFFLGVWSIPIVLAIALWARRSARRRYTELAYLDDQPEPLG